MSRCARCGAEHECWKPERQYDLGNLQIHYLRGHTEGAHRITSNTHSLLLLPDGRTSAKRRYGALLAAYEKNGGDLPGMLGCLLLEGYQIRLED